MCGLPRIGLQFGAQRAAAENIATGSRPVVASPAQHLGRGMRIIAGAGGAAAGIKDRQAVSSLFADVSRNRHPQKQGGSPTFLGAL
jgi:hypothetical protein